MSEFPSKTSQKELPKPITEWDWPATLQVPVGYDFDRIPDLSRENLEFLADKYNALIEYLSQQPSTFGETK